MSLGPADIASLSRLLDEALELNPAEREAWLGALPSADQPHAARLRDMLAARTETRGGRLSTLPKLGPDDATARTGERVGPYRLIREIGHGGMGSVWLAERADGAYKRQVALKLPRLAWGAGLAERMAREREIGMLLEHPNIARLYDAGIDERGRPFLALEFVDGQPIDAWCKAQALSVRDRLMLFVQVVRAVAYAHCRLVVHRDLKPSNVLVTPDGQAHLLDFGIAKLLLEATPGEPELTQEQGRVLTPHYASPEQVAGEAITVQSDVYSLGVLLYELLTGTLPIAPKRGTLGAVEEAILEGGAPAASVRVKDRVTAKALRGEVDAILAKAMQREPQRRYATSDSLAQDIERHLNGETVAARPDSALYRLHKALRRHGVGVSAAAAVVLAVLGGSGVAVVQAQRASKASERQRLVTDFVSDVFRIRIQSEDIKTTKADMSGDRLLTQGAVLIAQRFPGEPAMQAELYGVVSELFLEMGAGQQAVDYATRQIEALNVIRADDQATASAAIRLANAFILQGRNADADSRARNAAAILKEDSPLRAEALATQAQALLYMGKIAACEATLDELEKTVRLLGKETVSEAWLFAMRGWTVAIRNRHAESGDYWRRGIEIALRVEGPLSRAAIAMRTARSRQLISHRDLAGGREMGDAAIDALRQRGGASLIAAEVMAAVQANRLFGLEAMSYSEAIAAIDRAAAVLSAQSAAPDVFHKRVQFVRGELLAVWGDVASGWKAMSASVDALLAASDSPNAKYYVAASARDVARNAGDFVSADRFSREVFHDREAMGEKNHPFALSDHYGAAYIESHQGHFEQALALLDQASKLDLIGGDQETTARVRRFLDWARARVLFDSGDHDGAARWVSRLDAKGYPENRDLLAGLKCHSGQFGAGRREFDVLIAEAIASRYEHSPWLARLRGLAGLCAVADRDRAAARRLAELARAAFTAQPGVSAAYKAPLFKLESALGITLPPV
jgi:tetratricopeptide (TPR) repeat protein